ncbi:hypothetical protein CT0861_00301 [Colletotrichum tofieldiae]|uniref:Uncharacterized protein n=1 Tax=Colletotrichum tofieldiae TaxID=708197 RepID=A0A161VJ51_9PEZI|nr:hypothetical protein CT0861_00301 [Colletotrichum tofieldiae]
MRYTLGRTSTGMSLTKRLSIIASLYCRQSHDVVVSMDRLRGQQDQEGQANDVPTREAWGRCTMHSCTCLLVATHKQAPQTSKHITESAGVVAVCFNHKAYSHMATDLLY